jgi:rod shape-determining protein MreD
VRRSLLLAVVIVTALLLQTTVFADLRLLGARPELLYLVTIVFAFLDGPSAGTVAGFTSGMAEDFLLDQPKGITALTLTLLGYVVGLLRQYVVTPSPLFPVLLVAGGTFLGTLFYGVVSFLIGELEVSTAYLLRVAVLSALYNALLTPLLFPVLRRVVEASRAQKVIRW